MQNQLLKMCPLLLRIFHRIRGKETKTTYLNMDSRPNLQKQGKHFIMVINLSNSCISFSFGNSSSIYSTLMENNDVDGNCNLRLCSSSQQSEDEDMPAMVLQARKMNKKVILNVGGVKHEVMWRMLEKQPRSRLGLLAMATTQTQVYCFFMSIL